MVHMGAHHTDADSGFRWRQKIRMVCPCGVVAVRCASNMSPRPSESCIKGHRSSTCKHVDRPLYEIKKKGRPVTQCEHCRELRKTKQVHVKCTCGGAAEAAGPSGLGKGVLGHHWRRNPKTDLQGLLLSALPRCNETPGKRRVSQWAPVRSTGSVGRTARCCVRQLGFRVR